MKTYVTWSIENYFWNKIEQLMFDFAPKLLVFYEYSQFKFDSASDSSSARYIPWYSPMNCVNLTYFPNAVNWYLFC